MLKFIDLNDDIFVYSYMLEYLCSLCSGIITSNIVTFFYHFLYHFKISLCNDGNILHCFVQCTLGYNLFNVYPFFILYFSWVVVFTNFP